MDLKENSAPGPNGFGPDFSRSVGRHIKKIFMLCSRIFTKGIWTSKD